MDTARAICRAAYVNAGKIAMNNVGLDDFALVVAMLVLGLYFLVQIFS